MPCSATPPADVTDPLRLDPEWRTETVTALAQGVAADGAFDRLPILADALEESGCDNWPLLDHLRADESHRAECWALGLVLRRMTLLLPGGVPITFAYCPPGTFRMGSDHPELAHRNEQPPHLVTQSDGFFAGIYPVTRRQWRATTNSNPGFWGMRRVRPDAVARGRAGDDRPVEYVSWDDAQAFCWEASRLLGRAVRLPTEAEWEYACRAGTASEFHWGDGVEPDRMNFIGGYDFNSPGKRSMWAQTTAVGTFPANPWGLFDCHGNVWEWCQDWYDATYYRHSPAVDPAGPADERKYRVCRGGSHVERFSRCRSARRNWYAPDRRIDALGFRVVFTA